MMITVDNMALFYNGHLLEGQKCVLIGNTISVFHVEPPLGATE